MGGWVGCANLDLLVPPIILDNIELSSLRDGMAHHQRRAALIPRGAAENLPVWEGWGRG